MGETIGDDEIRTRLESIAKVLGLDLNFAPGWDGGEHEPELWRANPKHWRAEFSGSEGACRFPILERGVPDAHDSQLKALRALWQKMPMFVQKLRSQANVIESLSQRAARQIHPHADGEPISLEQLRAADAPPQLVDLLIDVAMRSPATFITLFLYKPRASHGVVDGQIVRAKDPGHELTALLHYPAPEAMAMINRQVASCQWLREVSTAEPVKDKPGVIRLRFVF